MGIFKRGKVYWYHFVWDGRHVQKSTRQGNPNVARNMEAAYRTALAKGEVGIVERKPAPTMTDFAKRFNEAVKVRSASKPRTVAFYAEQVKRLLEYEPLANARLSDVDERLVEGFVQHRSSEGVKRRTKKGVKHCEGRQVSPSTVNRALATLRRMMRLAQEWRTIDRVPRIRLLSGERARDYILSYTEETVYLDFAPQPLKDIATLVLDTGLRIGEALALEWADVHLTPNGSQWGYLQVREGKSRNARRAIPLTERAHNLLAQRRAAVQTLFVFADEGRNPYRVSSLDHMHARTRNNLKLPPVFVLHSLRHTYLTRLGLLGVDAFTIMKLAGHSSVTVSERYVHPTPRAMADAVSRLDRMNTLKLQSRSNEEEAVATEEIEKQPLQFPLQSPPAVSVSH